jgi:hypothetical protein
VPPLYESRLLYVASIVQRDEILDVSTGQENIRYDVWGIGAFEKDGEFP